MSPSIAKIAFVLFALSSQVIVSSGADPCRNFPFVDQGEPLWRDFAKGANLTTLLDSGYRLRLEGLMPYRKPGDYLLKVSVPPFTTYIGHSAQTCPGNVMWPNFDFEARLEGPDGGVERVEYVCRFNRRRILVRTSLVNGLSDCRRKSHEYGFGLNLYDYIVFNFSTCGMYNLSFFGKTDWAIDFHFLGNAIVKLPHFTELNQKEVGLTWAKLAFGKDNETCWPDRTYTVKCGSLIFSNVREDQEVLVYNLLPDSRNTCSYELIGPSSSVIPNVTFHTAHLKYFNMHSMPFSAHDHAICLKNDETKELVGNTNITVLISITDLKTNETFTAAGMDAFNLGVTGLKSATPYRSCLTLSQVEGTCVFDCKNQTLCFDVTTLPAINPHWKSLTGLWIICGILTLLFSCSLIMNFLLWMRLDVIGAPSSKLAWIQLKKRGTKESSTAEEAVAIDLLH